MSSAWMRDVLKRKIAPARGTSTVAQKAVLMVLAWHHHPDHKTVSVGTRAIADQCGMTRQAVMRAVDALIAAGVLRRVHEIGGRAAYTVQPVTPHDRTGHTTEPVTPHDRSHHGTGHTMKPPPVTPRDHHRSHRVTGVVTPYDHVEIREEETEENPPTPRGGAAPVEAAIVDEPVGDFGTVEDRFEAKREAQAHAAAGNVPEPPHLTGIDRDDAMAVRVWWSSMSGALGGVDRQQSARMGQLIAAQGPARVLAALTVMRGRGVAYPQPRGVAQCIKAMTSERISAERAQRSAPTGGDALTRSLIGDRDPFKFSTGAR